MDNNKFGAQAQKQMDEIGGASQRDPNVRPSVFEYSSSEECLRDFLVHLKHTKAMTLKSLSLKSSLSISLISMFVSGSRHLSHKATVALKEALPLSQPEKDYFELLIVTETSDSRDDVLNALKKIQNTKEFQTYKAEEAAIFEYYSSNLAIVLRELVQLKNFKEDPKWIQQVLNEAVTVADIRKALLFLEETRFLKRDEDGNLVVADRNITCMDKIMRLSLIDYHKGMLERAVNLLDKREARKDITGQTVAINSEMFAEVVALMKETRAKIREMEVRSLESNSANMVMHVGLAAFPLAEEKDTDEKEDKE